MTKKRLTGALLTAALILFSMHAAQAASRNCTAAEKAQADRQLKVIAADTRLQTKIAQYHSPLGLPEVTPAGNEQILYQGGYIMAHDADLMTSLWAAYQLTGQDVVNGAGKPRVNCFRSDPRLKRGSKASTTDYREPVFDQGHMANDADLKDNLLEQINSYVMSNMSPQTCRFNRGIWLSMEHLTRHWALRYGQIFVTTGAIFDRDGVAGRDQDQKAVRMRSNNGKSRVAVPSHYYKTFLRQDGSTIHAISFVFEHNNDVHGSAWSDVKPAIGQAISSIAVIERHASLDLYPDLQTPIVESRSGENWDFSTNGSNFEASCQ
jgi:endonuclease G